MEEWWRLDVRPLHLDPVVDANGKPVVGDDGKPKLECRTAGDHWVSFMTAWAYQNPKDHGGDQWVRRTEDFATAGAFWVTAVMLAEQFPKNGTRRTPTYIADDWGMKERQFQTHLADAEDAGLITVEGHRFGKTSPLRKAHKVAVPITERTSSMRKPSTKPPVKDTDTARDECTEEPPF